MNKLRIIIPTKNEESTLPLLLDSIEKQSYKNFEIVVADANSTDKTRSIAKSYGCKIVSGGYPDEGRNNGAKNCNSLLLCFIDADIILPNKNYLSEAVKEFNKRRLDVAGTLQKPISVNKKFKDLLYLYFYGFANYGMLMAQNTKKPLMQVLMFMKTKVHKEIGGFPPYEFSEDSALAKKAVLNGYKFGILTKPGRAWISTRRLGEKGFFKMVLKYVYLNMMRMLGKEYTRGKTRMKYW